MDQSFSELEIEQGLECYDPEGRLFPRLSSAMHRKMLTERDILLILKWKLGRIRKINVITVKPCNVQRINRAIEIAANAEYVIEAIEALQSIPGIGLATATALLTVCYPDDFTIIDWRVLETLQLSPSNTNDWTAAKYVDQYLPQVKRYSQQWRLSLRETDRALWGMSVSKRIDEIIVEKVGAQSADRSTQARTADA